MTGSRLLKNQQGVSVVELLIALAIGALVLGVGVIAFTKMQTLFKNQADSSVVLGDARLGIQELVRDLRMAGFGLPAAAAITSATATAITFLSNKDNLSTTVPGDLAAGATAITVNSAAGFAAGGNVVIFSAATSPKTYELKTIQSVAGNVITLTTGLANAYTATNITVVNGYHTVSFAFANNKITESTDGAATDVQNATGVTYSYFDKTGAALAAPVSGINLPNIRRINISLTLQDLNNANAKIATNNTEVNLRNMSP